MVEHYLKLPPAQTRVAVSCGLALLVVHVFSCIWWLQARLDHFGPATWVNQNGYSDLSYTMAYSYSFYWAAQTLTTVGYGDFGAYSNTEVGVTIVWMFLGVVFYSFVVGSLTTIMTTDNKAKELLIKQLAALDQFKDEANLDVTVYDGIYNFLINNHEEVFAVMDEGAMINNLPNNYKEELFYFQYGNLIEKLIFLKELPIELTWALVENLKKV